MATISFQKSFLKIPYIVNALGSVMDENHSSVGQLPNDTSDNPFKGFWIRLVAAIADLVILMIMTLVLVYVLASIAGALLGEDAAAATFILTLIAFSIALILYKPLMEASEYQGTLGKYILGMKVVNQRGERITMTTSFVRTIVYLVLTTIPGVNIVGVLGLIMIGFTEQKQGLHDFAAKTFVVPEEWTGPIVSQDGFV